MTDPTMPTQAAMDAFTEGLTKVVAGAMPDLIAKPEEFYLVSVRNGDAWNMKTGKASDWHRDTLALTTATTLREVAAQTDVILSPPEGMSAQEAVSRFNDVLASLTRDLLANAEALDPT